jgi:predicted GH43/DUF377 family glycosyl hydrolase
MRWIKKGLIFRAAGQYDWMAHHTSVPFPDKISDDVLRIYFGPRDAQNRTRVAFVDVDADNPSKVLHVHDRPVLDLGKRGAFDDSGAMPTCIVNHGARKYLYYVGWNQGVSVPYRTAIGLAVSTDGGQTFERVFDGPVVDRSSLDPYFCLTGHVIVDNGTWKLWYASTTGFVEVHGHPEPQYQIKYAESTDGRNWIRSNITCIEYKTPGEANGRPCVIKEKGRYRMWYCYRGTVDYRTDVAHSYRLGYAESADGLRWERLDHLIGIEPSADGWDSMMVAYPSVYEHRGRKYMLYAGNGFSETGFGYAVLEEDEAWLSR